MAAGSGQVALQSFFSPCAATYNIKFRLTGKKIYGSRSVGPLQNKCVCFVPFLSPEPLSPTVKSLLRFFPFSIFLILFPQASCMEKSYLHFQIDLG